MTAGGVRLDVVDDGIAVVTVDRPPGNPFDADVINGLHAAWRGAGADERVRIVVLRAEGADFCVGSSNPDPALDDATTADWAFERDLPKPTIAAVQGACVGVGQRAVWPCDLVVAADDAYFADSAVGRVGAAPGLTWEWGPRTAKLMLSSGARVPASVARRRGVVNRVVPAAELDTRVMALAREIAGRDPFALAQVKRAVNRTCDIKGQRYLVNSVVDFALGSRVSL